MIKPLLTGLVAAALIFTSLAVSAATVATARQGAVVVQFTDEPCTLGMPNLPIRVVWAESGKTFEGCGGLFGNTVVAFFDDKTIAVIPVAEIKKAEEV